MTDRRKLTQLLAKGLSGKEVACLALQSYMEEQAGKRPTFSEAEIERARAALHGRPQEAAAYNAWIEASRIVDYTSLEAIGKGLEVEKRLIWVTDSVIHLLRQGQIKNARQLATKILTPAQWSTFPARREQARRALLAQERLSFAEVTCARAWQLASGELKARVRALPEFEDESGNEYDYLQDLDEAIALELHRAAVAEIVALIKSRKLRFVRNGRNVSAKLRIDKHTGVTSEATSLAAEAECTLLELVEGGLPEWVERSKAEYFTPPEFRGPVAILQESESPPECLDQQGRFMEPGWTRVDAWLQREATPIKLQKLLEVINSCQIFIRSFLARKAIIEVFGQELGVDLFLPVVREQEEAILSMLANYNQLAERSWEAEPDEDGFVLPDEMLAFPKELRLPLIDTAKLEPDPKEVELMRQRLAAPSGRDGGMRRSSWVSLVPMSDTNPDRKERLRRRGQELGSINLAVEEMMRAGVDAGKGG